MYLLKPYFELAMTFIIPIIIVYFPIFLIMKERGTTLLRQFSFLLLLYSVFIIAFATIFCMPIDFNPPYHVININPFAWRNEVIGYNNYRLYSEVIPNILLFIPLGFILPSTFSNMRKCYKTIPTIFLVTFSIEFIQYFIGRSCDIDDILANLVGGIIGYILFYIFHLLFQEKNYWKMFLGTHLNN